MYQISALFILTLCMKLIIMEEI